MELISAAGDSLVILKFGGSISTDFGVVFTYILTKIEYMAKHISA